MKALSVKQPFANMICSGEKTVEQRTWQTSHRGDLIIVSSQKPAINPAGQTICIVDLVDCVKFTQGHVYDAKCEYIDGAFAWLLADIRPVRNVGISGSLGLYEVHDSVIEKIIKG